MAISRAAKISKSSKGSLSNNGVINKCAISENNRKMKINSWHIVSAKRNGGASKEANGGHRRRMKAAAENGGEAENQRRNQRKA
jgi:hypothetical protein